MEIETTTCDRGHEPITFAGAFWVLCPLCAAIREKAEAEGERCVDFNQAEHDKHITRIESRLETAREEIEKLENDAAGAASLIEMALDADDEIEGEAAARRALAMLKGE